MFKKGLAIIAVLFLASSTTFAVVLTTNEMLMGSEKVDSFHETTNKYEIIEAVQLDSAINLFDRCYTIGLAVLEAALEQGHSTEDAFDIAQAAIVLCQFLQDVL